MQRLVGKKKEKVPVRSLDDTSKNIGERNQGIEQKVKDIDTKLKEIKVKMKTAGAPQKARLKKQALTLLQRRKLYEKQSDQLGK